MIDKHLDLFYEHYKSQSKKSVVYAKKYCDAIAHRLRYDTSLPGNLRQDLIEIFSAGADGQSIDKHIGIIRPDGRPSSEAILNRNEKIWERMNELSDRYPTPKDRTLFLTKEFPLEYETIGAIYRERQKLQDELDQVDLETRDYEIWRRVTELLVDNKNLSECCAQLVTEFQQDASVIESAYLRQQQRNKEDSKE
ncbi:MAG: hypothetical protein AB2687_10685 [Candidatus Thiodiazotropha taylori]